MKALIQRVSEAAVSVDGETVGAIQQGLLLLLGVEREDSHETVEKVLHKVVNYRVFPDGQGKMNLNLQQVGGGLLIVSQFTLAADTRKGLRPGFSSAASPENARLFYDQFVELARNVETIDVASGIFAANMQITLVNDGPVTFLLEG